MDFPVSIPWETLDPEILQKAINSGSNYRTYCDEKSWDISFEIEFLEKEEKYTASVAGYVDEHLDLFAKIIK